ncbi:alpha-N-acetylglucosaminidase TIM-barrel domain-containing protein [Agromyces sp. H3Y2-19a]|uniref:alpha-N-acetylglucosaminidase TIM-barrel domain-containing protein n=1 Tax=Agromyces chromiiresistens TaxID=3030835 RepID=UPI0023B8E774|nr:alpha-N-acetylglucosaminidase TIM-barrel domain-containing protein [Agromyces chromiiresistens]MDF0513753.1 alpha-N-acetylglucosaminidase TIM-barrel domain-containing protein [Agromyces chromiiresistens]
MMHPTPRRRRRAALAPLATIATALLLTTGTAGAANAEPPARDAKLDVPPKTAPGLEPARDAVERLLGEASDGFDLAMLESADGADAYEITSKRNHVRVAATDSATAIAGVNAYLATIGQSVSWNVRNLDPEAALPLPAEPITATSNVSHRFYGNDTEDGYTGAYRTWDEWEREIDELAALGFNEVFMPVGSEAVYAEVLEQFGYSAEEARAWIPLPGHQPWWLLQNMSGYPAGTSEALLEERTELGRKIADRLRELDMTPVLPGYFGTVPTDFADRNADARVEPQGGWVGFQRPGWLDPNSAVFPAVAEAFYEASEEKLGASNAYKMDVLHEGGRRGSVDVPGATRAIETALQTAQPGATWVLLGWQNNPPEDVAAAVDPETTFIVDGLSDRWARGDLEAKWSGVPYAFGTIWNFGGHTTMGAELAKWNELFDEWLNRDGSRVDGIAALPEGGLNNPAAIDFFAGLAWRDGPIDVNAWFDAWTERRYGVDDPELKAAWRILAETAYTLPDNEGYSEAHDGLYGARPSLSASAAATWSPGSLSYDPDRFAEALDHLLAAAPAAGGNASYRYDLMDVARQVTSNTSRVLLPQLQQAYGMRDRAAFTGLSEEWLGNMDLLDAIVATQPQTLFGRWIADARAAGADAAEADRLEFDARSIVTTWGDRSAVDAGLNDYANREWQGLVSTYYKDRWERFFASIQTAFDIGRAPASIDWYAVGAEFTASTATSAFLTEPEGDIVELAGRAVEAHDATVPDVPEPPTAGEHFLSDLPFASVSLNAAYGPIERDTEIGEAAYGDGKPIRLAGVEYGKGLGVNSPTTIGFNLGGQCSAFAAVVGIDDIMNKAGASPNVIFRVVADGEVRYDSGAMTKGLAAEVDVDVTGVERLELVVDPNAAGSPAGQAEWWDRADWADAIVTCG